MLWLLLCLTLLTGIKSSNSHGAASICAVRRRCRAAARGQVLLLLVVVPVGTTFVCTYLLDAAKRAKSCRPPTVSSIVRRRIWLETSLDASLSNAIPFGLLLPFFVLFIILRCCGGWSRLLSSRLCCHDDSCWRFYIPLASCPLPPSDFPISHRDWARLSRRRLVLSIASPLIHVLAAATGQPAQAFPSSSSHFPAGRRGAKQTAV